MNSGTQPPQVAPPATMANPDLTYQSSGDTPVNPVPKWIGVMVALVIFGSMLGGGGLWAWSYYNRPDPKNIAEVLPQSTRTVSVAAPAPVARTLVPGIIQSSPTVYQVVAPDYTMLALKVAGPAEWNIRVQYRKTDLLSPDQTAARAARMRLAIDPAYAKSLNITDEQVEKIKALPAVAPVAFAAAPAELDRLKKMWVAFLAGNPPKAEEGAKIIAAVQEIGKATLESSRKTAGDLTKSVTEILTPEQLARFKPTP